MSKVCIVTGTARGLGEAIAARMAKDGYAVVGMDIGYPESDDLSNIPESWEAGVYAVHGDVADREAVHELVRVTSERLGGPHVIVNSAFLIHYAMLPDFTEEVLDRMISIGLKGMVWLNQAAAPAMAAAGGGAIVNITSITSLIGFPKASMYGSLKGAGASMTRQLAIELAPDKIRVNAVAPGFVPTPGSLGVVDAAGVERREARTPLQLATAEDIANAVAFLSSDQSVAITGQTIVVDGGMTVSL